MYAYSEIYYREEMIDEMIESEMHKVKEQVLERLGLCFAHFKDIKSLALTIAYGYWDSDEHAITVADQLQLGKLEFLAIAEDFDGFKEEFLKDMQRAENF